MEQAQHAPVLRKDVGLEARDAPLARRGGEARDEETAQPEPLRPVDDGERRLGDVARREAHEAGLAERLVAADGEQREVVDAVELRQRGELAVLEEVITFAAGWVNRMFVLE